MARRPASHPLARRVYRVLLMLFPRGFRVELGGEMTAAFAERLEEVSARRGWRGVLRLWRRTVRDVTVNGLQERLDAWRAAARVRRVPRSRSEWETATCGLTQDLGYAWRMFAKGPGFSVMTVLILAVGIAACAVLFSVVNLALLQHLPFTDPNSVVVLSSVDSRRPVTRVLTSIADFTDWRDGTRSFVDLAALARSTRNLSGAGAPRRVSAGVVTPGFFTLLGMPIVRGRGFDYGPPGSAALHVAVLGYRCWTREMSGRADIVGSTLTLDGVPFTVIGVLGESAERAGVFRFDVWVPLDLRAAAAASRGERTVTVLGRLKPGVTVDQATADLESAARRLQQDHPESNAGWTARVQSAREAMVSAQAKLVISALGVVVLLVLLIACADVAGMLLARATERRREFAVRLALGAGRARLVRQLLVEHLLIATAAGSVGAMLASAGLRLADAATRGVNPFFSQVRLDTRVLASVAAVALMTPIIFGVLPAVTATRTPPAEVLKSGGRVAGGVRGRRLLVVVQIAMAVVLLATTSLFVQTVRALRHIPLGFEPRGVLMMRVEPSTLEYPGRDDLRRLSSTVLEEVRRVAGVDDVAAASAVPIADRETTVSFTIEGRPVADPAGANWAARTAVSAGFLRTLDIPLVEGRDLSRSDDAKSPPVALVNRATAAKYWPGGDPIGARLRFAGPAGGPWIEIVGVVGDVRNSDADQPPVSQVYLPYAQAPARAFALFVRTSLDPLSLADPVRRAVWAADPNQPAFDVRSMEQVVFDDLADGTVLAGAFAAFGLVALVLALGGLYAMLSSVVGQRTRELGLRLALGAKPHDLVWLVLRDGLALVLPGITLGLAGGLAMGRMMAATLYGVASSDLLTFVGVPVLLTAAATAASLVPARRTARIDPTLALRAE